MKKIFFFLGGGGGGRGIKVSVGSYLPAGYIQRLCNVHKYKVFL